MGVLSRTSIRKRFHSQQESCDSITAPIHNQCLSRSGGDHHFLSNCWDNDQPKLWMLPTRVLKDRKMTNIFFLSLPTVFVQTTFIILQHNWNAFIPFWEDQFFHRNVGRTNKLDVWSLFGCPGLKHGADWITASFLLLYVCVYIYFLKCRVSYTQNELFYVIFRNFTWQKNSFYAALILNIYC